MHLSQRLDELEIRRIGIARGDRSTCSKSLHCFGARTIRILVEIQMHRSFRFGLLVTSTLRGTHIRRGDGDGKRLAHNAGKITTGKDWPVHDILPSALSESGTNGTFWFCAATSGRIGLRAGVVVRKFPQGELAEQIIPAGLDRQDLVGRSASQDRSRGVRISAAPR